MIVIPMLLASAVTGQTTKLGTVVICNDGSGTPTKSNYDVKIIGKNGKTIRTGRALKYRRKARPPFELILEALLAAGYTAKGK